MAVTVTRFRTFDDVSLQSAWHSLSDVCPQAGLCNTYEWCYHWWRHFGHEAQPAITVVSEDNAPKALAPMCTENAGNRSWLRLMGSKGACGDHLDFLYIDSDKSLTAITDDILTDSGRLHGIVLGDVDTNSASLRHIHRLAINRNWSLIRQQETAVPFLSLPQSFDRYVAGLSSNMRYHIRRRIREFSRLKQSVIKTISGTNAIDEILEEFFHLHRLRWERDDQSGNFQNEQRRGFLIDFCKDAAARGWLRLHAMQVNDKTLGILIAFHWKKQAYYYQMGWDPAGPIKSPGVILLATAIESAINEGLDRFDFMRGEEAYKSRWSQEVVRQTTLVVGQSASARIGMLAAGAAQKAKYAARNLVGDRNWEALKASAEKSKRRLRVRSADSV